MVALLVSDIHLQRESPHTAEAFFGFLRRFGSQTEQLYLLGDLFEYWAGDDECDTPFNRRVIAALRALSSLDVKIFWISGNRDFLVGEIFLKSIGATVLADPSVVVIGGIPTVLTHGDALCTDDVDYQAFRALVRTAAWQQTFLAMSLQERLAVVGKMRNASMAAQRVKAQQIMDVNAGAVDALFIDTDTSSMIHGHTHRPGTHETVVDAKPTIRRVLTDWDFENGNSRGGGLAIYANGTVEILDAANGHDADLQA